MICRVTLSGLALLAATAWHPAQAANAVNGQRLARTLCTNCRIVEPGGASNEVVAGVPSFMAAAAKEGQSAEKIGGYILNPHPPMPKVQFTTAELADVAVFIMTLKAK